MGERGKQLLQLIRLATWPFIAAASTLSRSPTIVWAVIAISDRATPLRLLAQRRGRRAAIHDGHLALAALKTPSKRC
ncbi:hypothetical protein OKW41_001661 [Paraburkholderia sp. UCT70]|uniref:hypothetical protein n=1 Tax=Paraburkholderia sp. UCT70 TaxID=2991068 RepID=UPI003D1DF2EB